MFRYNSLRIDGNNNIVLQDVDGQTVSLTFDTFINKLTEEKDKRIADLEKLISRTESLSSLELEKAGSQLQLAIREKDMLKDSVTKLLQDFNGKNLTDTSTYYKEAFTFFTNGEIQSALTALDNRNIKEDLDEILREEQLAKAKMEKINLAKKRLASELLFKAQLLAIEKKVEASKKTYEEAIDIYKDFDSVSRYALFLHFLNEYPSAEKQFLDLLRMDLTEKEKFLTLNELGLIETSQNNFNSAISFLKESLKIAEGVENPEDLARSYLHLGNVYMKTQEFDLGLDAYQMAEKNYLLQLDSSSAQVSKIPLARTKLNIGWAYLEKALFREAEKYYTESIRLYDAVLREDSSAAGEFANALSNIGQFYDAIEQYDKAIDMLSLSVKFLRQLASENRYTYEFELANALNKLGIVYQHKSYYPDAIRNYKEALEIAERFENALPMVYKPNVADFYNNLALLYEQLGAFEESEKNYLASISRKRALLAKDRSVYLSTLALSLGNLAVVYERMKKPKEAIEYSIAALNIYEELEKKNSFFVADMARLYRNIGVIFEGMQNYDTAANYHRLALGKYLAVKTDLPEAFDGEVSEVRQSLAVALLNSGHWEEGIKELVAANRLLYALYQAVPEKYYLGYALSLINIAKAAVSYQTATTEQIKDNCAESRSILEQFQHLGNPLSASFLESIIEIETAIE
ncbi:MAG: tetratricopeptide repeat protein [Gemmatimonadaceae bacterium]|nr:tetratricopeptide repeat protein [Chitinophagaceae bacterium]